MHNITLTDENIDKKRAESAKERAEKRISDYEIQQNSEVNLSRAKQSLGRAQIRLDILAQNSFK